MVSCVVVKRRKKNYVSFIYSSSYDSIEFLMTISISLFTFMIKIIMNCDFRSEMKEMQLRECTVEVNHQGPIEPTVLFLPSRCRLRQSPDSNQNITISLKLGHISISLLTR